MLAFEALYARLFGITAGILINMAAKSLAASMAFFAGRYFLRDYISARLSRYPSMAAIRMGIANDGWRFVLLARRGPASPLGLRPQCS